MATRGETAAPIEDWIGVAAMITHTYNNTPPEVRQAKMDGVMEELYSNMPDAIAEMGNNFLAKIGLNGTIP